MKIKEKEPNSHKRLTCSFFEILKFQVRVFVQKIGILCKNFFLGLKFTCNNNVLDNLTLLRSVVQRSKVYLAKCTVTGTGNCIGGHKSVNPLITKLTFSLTR